MEPGQKDGSFPAKIAQTHDLMIPLKSLPLLRLGLVLLAISACGATTPHAKEAPPERWRSVHEDIVLNSIGKGSFVVVACPFAFELKKLSPEKYVNLVDYTVVKKFNGNLEFGAKFRVAYLVEGDLAERPPTLKPNLGDFKILVLYDQPHKDQPFEAAHTIPYNGDFEAVVIQQVEKKVEIGEPRPQPPAK